MQEMHRGGKVTEHTVCVARVARHHFLPKFSSVDICFIEGLWATSGDASPLLKRQARCKGVVAGPACCI